MQTRFFQAAVVLAELLLFLAPGAVSGAERFQLKRRDVASADGGSVASYVVVMATNQMAFVPPADWQVRLDANQKKVILSQPQRGVVLALRLLPEPTDPRSVSGPDRLRKQVQLQFPQAQILEESSHHSAASDGYIFDLVRPVAGDLRLASRLAFVPLRGGSLELNLTTAPERIEQYYSTFKTLLDSFRLEPLGQTE